MNIEEQLEVIRQNQSAGRQQVVWNAEGLPNGVYFCGLKTKDGTKTMDYMDEVRGEVD